MILFFCLSSEMIYLFLFIDYVAIIEFIQNLFAARFCMQSSNAKSKPIIFISKDRKIEAAQES